MCRIAHAHTASGYSNNITLTFEAQRSALSTGNVAGEVEILSFILAPYYHFHYSSNRVNDTTEQHMEYINIIISTFRVMCSSLQHVENYYNKYMVSHICEQHM